MIFGSIIGFLSGQGICVDDSGYVGGGVLQSAAIVHDATMWAAVQTAMMLWQRDTNSRIADIRQQLADRRMVMAELALEHAKLAWVKEKAFVTETMAVPKYTPEYTQTYFVGDAVERAWEYTDTSFDERTAKMGLTVNQCDDARVARGMATAKTDLMANAMRVAEARTLHLNDRRFSRQLAALGLGRDKLMVAAKLGELAEAGSMAVRNAALSAFNIGMGVWGYEENRWRSGQAGQWGDRFNRRTVIAPVETRDYRFVPDSLTDQTVYVQPAPGTIEQSLATETAATEQP